MNGDEDLDKKEADKAPFANLGASKVKSLGISGPKRELRAFSSDYQLQEKDDDYKRVAEDGAVDPNKNNPLVEIKQ